MLYKTSNPNKPSGEKFINSGTTPVSSLNLSFFNYGTDFCKLKEFPFMDPMSFFATAAFHGKCWTALISPNVACQPTSSINQKTFVPKRKKRSKASVAIDISVREILFILVFNALGATSAESVGVPSHDPGHCHKHS